MSSDLKNTGLPPLVSSSHSSLPRRQFLQRAGGLLAAAGLSPFVLAQQAGQHLNEDSYVSLPPIHDVQTEGPEKAPGPFESNDHRVGFAIVGLGRLL